MERYVYTPVRSLTELEPGRSIETPGRTLFESDIALFCGLSGDSNPVHLNTVAAQAEPLGYIVAPATLVASMAIGLFAGTRWLSAVLLPFLGMSDWRVERPVFPGDTIWSRVSIVEARLTSDGQRYVLELRFDVFAHRGAQAPVQTGATARRTPEREERVMTFNARFLARDHRSHDVGNEPPGSRYWSCQCLTTPPTRR